MRLDEVTARDVDWIAQAAERWSCSRRWSLRGQTVSPRIVQTLLQAKVSWQRAARRSNGTPVALLQLVDVERVHGHGQVAVLLDPDTPDSARNGVQSFLQAAFRESGLRKVSVAACADELDVPTYFGDVAHEIGRLVGHERRSQSSYADLLLYEIWNDAL